MLRLKGGDPFVFGRGGEEALTLVEHGIPFRIVPGITAGIGGLAYAGIPVTHREVNHAVTFLTGHDSSGVVPDRINWEGIAKGSPVIVMYMAMKHIGQITANLIAGRPLAERAGRLRLQCRDAGADGAGNDARRSAEADVAASGLEPPAIVVVGEVVRLRSALDWLGALEGGFSMPIRCRAAPSRTRHDRPADRGAVFRLRKDDGNARTDARPAQSRHCLCAGQGRTGLYRSGLSRGSER